MQDRYLKNVIEAALLAAGRPVPLEQLMEMFGERDRPEPAEMRAALEQLAEEYAERGIELREVASGFRIQVRRNVTEFVGRLLQERPRRYSRAMLETLALIAYRQPITRGEIEEVRGVTVNPDIVRTLFERNWIRVVGHREVPGRPELLGTTRDFLDYFGLKSLDDLPTLAELRDMDNLGVQLELPGQEGDAQRVDAILTGDAADDEMAAPADDDGAEDDEESGTGSPQASGLVARQSDD